MWRWRPGRSARGWPVRRRVLVLTSAGLAVLVAATVALVVGTTSEQHGGYRTGRITILTGGTQGIYYQYGEQLAAAVNARLRGVHADVLATDASVDNMRRVALGPNVFAFTAADAASAAVAGRSPFAQPVPIRALARIYDDYMHLVVRASAPIHDITDLRGERVSIGSDGSGTQLIVRRLLDVAGVSLRSLTAKPLSIDDSIAALERGDIDAFFWSGGLPTAGITTLSERSSVRLVPLGQLATPLHQLDTAYQAESIPADTYPRMKDPADTSTVAVPDLIVTRADTDPGLVEQITRILFEASGEIAATVPVASALDRRVAISTEPVPLATGALRYYRSTKI